MGEEGEMETDLENDLKAEIEIFDNFCKVNDAIIQDKKVGSVMPICAIIGKDRKVEIIGMVFRNTDDKLIMKRFLFNKILSKKIKGYILFLDAKMTLMDLKNKENSKVVDVIVRGLYTPKKTIKRFCFYKNHKILHEENKKFEENFKKSKVSPIDEWDLFNSEHLDSSGNKEYQKLNVSYQKFKEENPEKYKEVC